MWLRLRRSRSFSLPIILLAVLSIGLPLCGVGLLTLHWAGILPGNPFGILGGAGPDSFSGDAQSGARAALAIPGDAGDEEHRETPSEPEVAVEKTGFLGFPHQERLNPQLNSTFVVSLRFRFSTVSVRRDRRLRLASKFGGNSRTKVPGWAIAIRPLLTSTHPEIYWQPPAGNGGWFTFDRFDLRPEVSYDLTLFARPEDQMTVVLKEVVGSGRPSGERTALQEEQFDGFLGGYGMKDQGAPAADTELSFPSEVGEVSVSRLLVAQVGTLKLSRKSLTQFARGGADALRDRLKPGELVLDYPPAQPSPITVSK